MKFQMNKRKSSKEKTEKINKHLKPVLYITIFTFYLVKHVMLKGWTINLNQNSVNLLLYFCFMTGLWLLFFFIPRKNMTLVIKVNKIINILYIIIITYLIYTNVPLNWDLTRILWIITIVIVIFLTIGFLKENLKEILKRIRFI